MRLPVAARRRSARAGFTLAEVAVTLLIVSMGCVFVLQGLTTAKMDAAETHYRKIARELALLTLGQVESGLFWEELDGDGDRLTGTYAEEGYEDFDYELAFGDEEFLEDEESRSRYDQRGGYHDSWQYDREREERARDRRNEDDDEERVEEPFEKVRIRVGYPHLTERVSTLVLERWMPWEQVYGNENGESGGAASEEPEE